MGMREEMIAAIAEFRGRTQMCESTFGRLAMEDPNFVGGLSRGRRVFPETIERVYAFMKDYESGKARKTTKRRKHKAEASAP
jgi:hypothetical protein